MTEALHPDVDTDPIRMMIHYINDLERGNDPHTLTITDDMWWYLGSREYKGL